MNGFKMYEIPDYIRTLSKMSHLDEFNRLISQSRVDEQLYTKTYETLLYMEEEANSKIIRRFDLQKIEVKLHSNVDNVYKIDYKVCFTHIKIHIEIYIIIIEINVAGWLSKFSKSH